MAMATVVLSSLVVLLGALAPFPTAAHVFCDNLKLVAASLPGNTSSSPVYFATTAIGNASDVVYALAFCRGDVFNNSDCGQCVATLFEKMLNATPPPPPPWECYGANNWYGDLCSVFYSWNNIIAPFNATEEKTDDAPFVKWNINNVTGDVDLIVGLTRKLLEKTVERAASTTPRRFATGIMNSGTAYPSVYSLAQCTPDLSASDCSTCLRRLLNMVNSTMAPRMGAQIHVIRCYFRYEAYAFYNSEPMLRLRPPLAPAPAPTPANENKRRMSKLWAIPIVVVPLAVGALLCFILYSRRQKRQRKGSSNTQDLQEDDELVWQGKNSEFSVFEFDLILEATNNFAEENKL